MKVLRATYLTQVLTLFLLCILVAGTAWATSISETELSNQSGVNDSITTAQSLGAYTSGGEFLINGAISSTNVDDVDFYSFTLGATTGLFFDIDNAELVSGVDTTLAVFNSAGTLQAYGDTGDLVFLTDPGSRPGNLFNPSNDPLIGVLTLGSGTYFVAVASYPTMPYAVGLNNLFLSGLSLSGNRYSGANLQGVSGYNTGFEIASTTGAYQLRISDAFDGAPIPEPTTMALVSFGLLGFAGFSRRRHS